MPLHRIPGKYIVRQLVGKNEHRRDFDAEEWSFRWVVYEKASPNPYAVLQLLHDRDPEATDSFDFVEFSLPVSIAFERE